MKNQTVIENHGSVKGCYYCRALFWTENMKFLHATGKWKGIKGSKGKTAALANLSPGTIQSSKYVGTFELAK
jgi:hypothetical protein